MARLDRSNPWWFRGLPEVPGHVCELGAREDFEGLWRDFLAVRTAVTASLLTLDMPERFREESRETYREALRETRLAMGARLDGWEPNLDRVLSPH